MKTGHIIAIVVIAAAIGIMITTLEDASQYVAFEEAFSLAEKGGKAKVHVVGQLKKDPQGKVLEVTYNPARNPNYFAFTLVDSKGREEKVIYRNPKPADFERSEQVVVVGSVQKGYFMADKILMKCPSKYQEKEVKI